MSQQARVVSIQLCPGHREPMRFVEGVQAITDWGLQGDSHARSGRRRQVLLIEKETLDELGLRPGLVKENITTQGINLMALSPGQQLHLGKEVIIEVTGECEPCGRMDEIRQGLQAELQGRRGMLGRVVVGGAIRCGDSVAVG